MVQPIDYTVPMQNPLAAFEQAANMGMGIRQNQQTLEANRLKIEAEKVAQARQAEIQAAIGKLSSPDATADDYANISMLLPKDQAESVRAAYEMKDKASTESALRDSSQVFTAFNAGKPEIAIKLMSDKVAALRNSGKEQEAAYLENWLEVAKDDPDAAKNFFGFTISQMPGGKDLLQSAIDFSKAPAEIEKGKAEADRAGSLAKIDEAKAKWAPKNEEANYRDLLAGIGLKGAQTSAAQASAESSRASAAASRATAGREAAETRSLTAGVIPAAKRPEAETALRKEYLDQTKDFRIIDQAYRRLKTADNTGVGDITRIFAIMKMNDPTSVVREGEQATAENAGGVPEKIRNQYNKLIKGDKLSPNVRAQYLSQGGSIFNAALEGEAAVRNGITKIAAKGGLDGNQIFYEGAPQKAPTTPNGPRQTTGRGSMPGGTSAPSGPQGRAASGGKVDTSNPLLR
jgi:hypothetical protein